MKIRALSFLCLSLLGAAASLSSGCASYVDFTQEMVDQHHLVPKDLQALQFYNSDKITLRRELTKGSRAVTGSHKLLVIAGKEIEEVVIEKHTPGVIVGVGPGTLKVSFEEGTFIEFALRGVGAPLTDPVVASPGFATPPDAFPGNRPTDPETVRNFIGSGSYYLLPNGGSSIEFSGQTYDVVDGADVHLVIASASLEEEQQKRTILKGRQL
jgi:hypothetical protein